MRFVVRSQEGQQLKVQTKEIYYNQISLWSKLKEDVKIQSRLSVVRVIHSAGVWTFWALAVFCEFPSCCFPSR